MERISVPGPSSASAAAGSPPWLARAFTTAARHFQAGLLTEAKQLLVAILEREPQHSDSLYLLASIAAQSGDLDLGRDLLRQAIAIEPRKTPYWVLFGNLFQCRGELDASAECYRQALTLDPQCFDALYNWGNTLEREGRFREATECWEKTLALRPDHVQARTNLANQYRLAGRLEEAAAHLETARAQDPRSMPVVLNLGNVFMAQSRYEEALQCFDQCVAMRPEFAIAHNNRGNVLRTLNRIPEAIEAFRRALDLEPGRAEFWVNLGMAIQCQGKLAEALEALRKALALNPDYAPAHGSVLFTLHYDPNLDDQSLLDEHKRWAGRHTRALPRVLKRSGARGDPDKRLRIGYVSPDFRQHPVAFFTAPVFAAHDRTGFEVALYATQARADGWTERVRAGADQFVEAFALSDGELAERIACDQIDVLVDLSGHTAGNRLLVFARRPAPVQLSWLGYFNTTGMEAMDYLVVDSIVAPPDEPAPFVEKPLRLAGCYLSYAGPDYAPPVSAPPSLQKGFTTYGCFNTLSKITPEVIALWAAILQSSPRSRLILKNAILDDALSRQLYQESFRSHGIGPERVRLEGSSPHAELLATYSQVDVALDPFPYNGGTTTCEALWMGVPVVSLAGDRFVSRVGETILEHAGCGDWVTRTPDKYVEKALDLGANGARLARMRALLREQVRRSTLGDTARFTRSWEDALRTVWRSWCAGNN
jgi:predicted O-linked N-acetylglucosamine transferase (SPINDLY family)